VPGYIGGNVKGETMEETYKVYIKVNEEGYITEINSSAFIKDTSGWMEIDEGYGDKYYHAQGNYLPNPLMTEEGEYSYKYINNEVTENA